MPSRPDLLPWDLEGKLAHYIEEVGESLKAIGKFNRFGPTPTDSKTGSTYDNIADILLELDDVIFTATKLNAQFRKDFGR